MSGASPTLVIAEAGVNHNGSVDRAVELVRIAAASGADLVKFQTFSAHKLATREARQAAYQARNLGRTESQFEMLSRLELSVADHRRLADESTRAGIEFLSTPFDPESAEFLVKELGVRRLKVGSGDLTNGPLLLADARLGVPVILSTGLGTLGEVEDALAVLAFGYVAERRAPPGAAAFAEAYGSSEGRAALEAKVTVLHCTTEYPAPPAAVNLRAMDLLARAFGLPTGYSDHTSGIGIALAAVARGAAVIEKHYTMDRGLPGPDHACSLEPDELKALVRGIREVEQALGPGLKWPSPVELPNREVARKSIVAAGPIQAGELFTADNLGIKRPGTGMSPMRYWDVLGRTATRDYAPDEPIAP